MEKSKVASCAVKKQGSTKDGKPYTIHAVVLENGTRGDCFDEVKPGQEIEYDFIPNANPQYDGTIKIKKQPGGKFAPKDYGFEKRRVALECATTLVAGGKITLNQLAETRDKFLTYLEGGHA